MKSLCCGMMGRQGSTDLAALIRNAPIATGGRGNAGCLGQLICAPLSNGMRNSSSNSSSVSPRGRSSSNSVRFEKLASHGEEATFVGPMHIQVPVSETQGKRLIVVGDVHGCVVELKALLAKVCFDGKFDYLCFVGDLVGKGPAPLEVVSFVRSLGAAVVRGNHEQRVLRYAHGLETWRREPSTPSEHEILARELPVSDLEWFQSLPLSIHFHEHDVLVVHAGVPPGQTADVTDPNLLMNIRNITDDGLPTSKSGEGQVWANNWRGQPDIVFGHDAQRGYCMYDHAIGLDSGCVYGGSLTALVLPDRAVVTVAAIELYCDPHNRT